MTISRAEAGKIQDEPAAWTGTGANIKKTNEQTKKPPMAKVEKIWATK